MPIHQEMGNRTQMEIPPPAALVKACAAASPSPSFASRGSLTKEQETGDGFHRRQSLIPGMPEDASYLDLNCSPICRWSVFLRDVCIMQLSADREHLPAAKMTAGIERRIARPPTNTRGSKSTSPREYPNRRERDEIKKEE